MGLKRVLIVIVASLGGVSFAAMGQMPVAPASPVPSDGLVRVQSGGFDEFYVRPKSDLASYRKVIIEPAHVSMQRGWLKSVNSTRDVTRWITSMDMGRITDAATTSMSSAVATAFRGRGYEIVAAPGPGVLRLSPIVPDLWVNAPDVQPADPARYASVDAGDATLILEARDSVSGALLARVVDRNTARQTFHLNRTTTTSNVFWFETMFGSWATRCAKEFEAAQVMP